MDNPLYRKKIIIDTHSEFEELKRLGELIEDKERLFMEREKSIPLSEYSTTQLKAELRRRKRERGVKR